VPDKVLGLLEQVPDGRHHFLQIKGFADDFERIGGANQPFQGGLVGGGQQKATALCFPCLAHKLEKLPVLLIGRCKVVDDHLGPIGGQERHEVLPSPLESRTCH